MPKKLKITLSNSQRISNAKNSRLEVLKCLRNELQNKSFLKNINITIYEFYILLTNAYLNDLIIDSYFELILKYASKERDLNVYAFNATFYAIIKNFVSASDFDKLVQDSFKHLKLDIFTYDLVIWPVCEAKHWIFVVFDGKSSELQIWNSKNLLHQDGKGFIVNDKPESFSKFSSWSQITAIPIIKYIYAQYRRIEVKQKSLAIVLKHSQTQPNEYDCGVFVCMFARHIINKDSREFKIENLFDWRTKILFQLIHGEILYDIDHIFE
ncbi:Protease, Ulp1 family [Pseudoloma neurophilia]|uniref:Protease, Ulp1 family n=1 Tax=Pseudoloma neurophilia TaxID=146866 RepID=A0A0R0LZX2_9MICR|nr:Protease, Ulp1 family [Pseudoloma neurophilia]